MHLCQKKKNMHQKSRLIDKIKGNFASLYNHFPGKKYEAITNDPE